MRLRLLLLFLLVLPPVARCSGGALDRASAAQQTAIAELVQSLKSARRVISANPPAGGDAKRNAKPVFRDRQTFLLPEMPRSENPGEQLNARIEEQKKLLDDMRRIPADDAAAREKMMARQKEIREKIPGGTGRPLPGETPRHLQRARNAMTENEAMLRSGQPAMARSAAEKALADLKRAAGEIAGDGDRKMQRSLSAAQREIERLAGKSGGGSAASPADPLRSLADRLLADAVNQHRTGRQSHAEDLAELARQIHDAAASGGASALPELADRIRALRLKGRNARRVLEESLPALAELAQQLRFTAKHPESLEPAEKIQLRDDLLMELENVELALGRLKSASGGNSGFAGCAARAANIRNALPSSPAEPAAARELAGEIETLCSEVRRLLNRIEAAENVYLFNPDDVPARYRDDVAKYFELLSEAEEKREGRRHE